MEIRVTGGAPPNGYLVVMQSEGVHMKYLIALTLFACLGCGDTLGPDCSQSSPCRLTIESNTSWSGSLGGTSNTQSYDGSGNGWIEYWGQVCYTLQMQTDVGYLRATFQETSTGHAETTAAFGVISGCN